MDKSQSIPIVGYREWKAAISQEIKAYVENRRAELVKLAGHPEQDVQDLQYKEGSDTLGSALVAAGVLVLLQAGAPVNIVIDRVLSICKVFRGEELKADLEARAAEKQKNESRIIIARS